jgi:phosphatidylserine decarboxylase
LTRLADNLFVGLQRLLPVRLLGRFIYRLSRSRKPWLKNTLIQGFARLYAIDTTEMDRANPDDYESLNAFFTRGLRPGARPVDDDPDAVCSPADGTVQQIGHIKEGLLLQVKGMHCSLADLLGIDGDETAAFDGGAFLTVYLAPHNYHRVHMPIGGEILDSRHLPGRRLAVNTRTARTVPGLFAGNERLACRCRGQSGNFWLVFVGAMNVASISTVWAGEVPANVFDGPVPCAWSDGGAVELQKGDYCGHFNMGSTVIAVFERDAVNWTAGIAAGFPVVVGGRVGMLTA